MATHLLPLSKNMSCTSTPQGKHLCQIPWESVKNWGSSSRRKIFPHFLPIICRYHGNALFATVKKCVLHNLHPKTNICAKFHENRSKTEEVVHDARFSPIFAHNMPLPWQHTFLPLSKNVSCTSTPQDKHLCKFHENRSKTEEVVRDANLRPPDRPTDRRHADSYIPPYTLPTLKFYWLCFVFSPILYQNV